MFFGIFLAYVGDHLLAPILAALVGGPLVALTFRYFNIPKEVADYDARAAEINEDLRRWVRDRNRALDAEIRSIVNTAGNQLYSGALINKIAHAMHRALHEYRDEATVKIREFSALARAEGRWHRRYRRRHRIEPPSLRLSGQERIALQRWRQRPHPVAPGSEQPDIKASHDPTANEPTIEPLETDEGITWDRARNRSTD